METAKEILKFKQNSTNHILHFPPKGSSQLDGTYLHISIVDEAMEEFSSLQNRSLVEENEALKARLEKAYDFLEKLSDESGTLLRIRINELLTK